MTIIDEFFCWKIQNEVGDIDIILPEPLIGMLLSLSFFLSRGKEKLKYFNVRLFTEFMILTVSILFHCSASFSYSKSSTLNWYSPYFSNYFFLTFTCMLLKKYQVLERNSILDRKLLMLFFKAWNILNVCK